MTRILNLSSSLEEMCSGDPFVQKVEEAVLANLADYNLDVTKLCHLIGASRTQLHERLTSATGMSTTEFVRYVRLHVAADLLQHTPTPISQIAYSTGFNQPSYFTRTFRDLFGESPTEYRTNHQAN